MEYSIRELADLAGISTRTLRYYDEIDLLKPCKVNENGMRFYGKQEVDLLQQIRKNFVSQLCGKTGGNTGGNFYGSKADKTRKDGNPGHNCSEHPNGSVFSRDHS